MAHSVFCAPFSPPTVTITGQDVVWGGDAVNVTFDLEGRDCDVYLAVYTKDQSANIPWQVNGAAVSPYGLDYHYFGQVDTLISVTAGEPFTVGTGRQIYWDGLDKNGNAVPLGEYTYYLLANDAYGDPVRFGDHFGGIEGRMDQYGAAGGSNLVSGHDDCYATIQYMSEGVKLEAPRVWMETSFWDLGNDTESGVWWSYPRAEGCTGNWTMKIAIDPDDSDIAYISERDDATVMGYMAKILLNNDAPAEYITDWGEDGKVWMYEFKRANKFGPALQDGILHVGNFHRPNYFSMVVCADKETGDIIREVDMFEWYVNSEEDVAAGSYAAEGPGYLIPSRFYPHRMACTHWISYRRVCFDPTQEELFTWWANYPGDDFADHGSHNAHFDSYDFLHCICHGGARSGLSNMSVLGPDGSGICTTSILGQISGGYSWWGFCIDNDTAYDGEYSQICTGAQDDPDALWEIPIWIGYDICMGTITAGVGVESETPVAFSLSNAPDPFNPSTTITYGMAKAGHVTIDVYNVMGQKVATLYDGNRDVGTYSVRWDASDFANGVYIAVMTGENFVKTEKMMLIK